jgi:hypothetical protein
MLGVLTHFSFVSVCSPFSSPADPSWVARRAILLARRHARLAGQRRRTGVPFHQRRHLGGGVEQFRKTKTQRFRGLKPRKAGEQPPQGEFPQGMEREAAGETKGHGQTIAAITQTKIKRDKEYY